MDIKQYMNQLGRQARLAARLVAAADTGVKNRALLAIAAAVDARRDEILAANAKDVAAGEASGLDAALLDRLALNAAGIAGIIEGLTQVAALADPVGAITDLNYRPSGIQVGKMRVPLGVIGIIYELSLIHI